MPRLRTLLPGLSLLLFIGGCAPTYRDIKPGTRLAVNDEQQSSAIVERQVDTLPSLSPEPAPPAEYQIGPGDLLSVTVYGRPELGSAASGASGTTGTGGTTAAASRSGGSRVDENGNLRLPLVGSVAVAGLSLSKAEEKLAASYRELLKEPWVTVEVVEHRSRPLYLFGSFRKPGVFYMDRPMTLLQGIALAEGFDGGASLRSARLSRNGKVQPVDIYELLANGDQRQNVWLHPGDAIYLSDKGMEQVFVFGAVSKAGPVPMFNGQLSLAQAIAASTPLSGGFDFSRVRIIRSLSPTRGELLVVDFDRIMRGEAASFMLANGDIVYLPRTSLGSWNDAINEILPSLQFVTNLLSPYVTIKWLTGR
jgi:polysaccharide export outer membrane protein